MKKTVFDDISSFTKEELKIWFNTDNIGGHKCRENFIFEHYPDLHKEIIDFSILNSEAKVWKERVYNYFYDVKENPKCEICGKTLHISTKHKNYPTFCSKECYDKKRNFKPKKENIDISAFSKGELKEWFLCNNYGGYKTREDWLKLHYPILLDKILKNTNEINLKLKAKIYLYIYDLKESPKCQECGNKCNFRDHLTEGFTKYCCNKCSLKQSRKYNGKNKVNIENYASFSDFIIKNYKNGMSSNECYIKESNPIEYNEIINLPINLNNIPWREKLYNYTHGIIERPICPECGKPVKFKNFNKGYRKFCSKKCQIVFINNIIRNNYNIIIAKRKETNLKKYGVEHAAQNKEIQEKIQQTIIEKYGEIYAKYIPKYNINSIIYLDILAEKLNLHIQHALNGGEKRFIKYWIDGYSEKYNVCIEWNEKYHYTKKNIEKDIKRNKFLVENFRCKMIYIKEKEFLKDVEKNIEILCNEINEYIKTKTVLEPTKY